MSSLRHRGLLPAVALALFLPSGPAEAQRDCTEWTPWDPIHQINVLWSWRMCPAPAERYDIQWRFANNGPENIEFRYQLFTGSVSECGERNRGQTFASGKVRLGGGERHDRYTGRRRLRETGFQQNFWLYLCVIEVVEPGAAPP